MNCFWLLFRAGLLLATLAGTAFAHDPFEITTVARMTSDAMTIEATMARSTALALTTRSKVGLEALAPMLYQVSSDGTALTPRAASTRLTEESDVEITTVYDRPRGRGLDLDAHHLRLLPEGYTSAVRFADESSRATAFKLLIATDPVLHVPLAHALSDAPSSSQSGAFVRFLLLGVKHILTGYDHLLFLAGLLVVCRSLRPMLALITCFTVAHSLTLVLAALGALSIPARIVEPLIAISIVCVGLENLLLEDSPKRRLFVCFAFGLVHGLGFAALLGELEVGADRLPLALFSFNLGVELGQLALSALALPLLFRLHTSDYGAKGLRVASAVVSGMGLFWLFERLA